MQLNTKQLTILVCIALFTSVLGLSCSGKFVVSPNTSAIAGPTPPMSKRAIQSRDSRIWKPATFRGLTFGKSKLSDLQRVLGKPFEKAIDNDEKSEQTFIVLAFRIDQPFIGTLRVDVKKSSGVLEHGELIPESVKKSDVLRYFGDDYVITRYSFDECLGDFDSAPLYESLTGEVHSLEYREKGIAVALSEDGDDVRIISYLSKPLGAVTSRCESK